MLNGIRGDTMSTEDIKTTLSLFLRYSPVIEIRIPKANRFGQTFAGYFDNIDAAVNSVKKYDGKTPGIYFTLNPINPALLARYSNRTEENAKQTTSDGDVSCRAWIYLDIDPVRPAGVSSTNEEHKNAISKAYFIREDMIKRGWSAPIIADSGNSASLLYKINMPNTLLHTEIIKKCIEAFDFLYSDDKTKIDLTVYNPARIVKLYGTFAKKGDNTTDRPHRESKILETPTELKDVTIEQVTAFNQILPKEQEPDKTNSSSGFDVEAWLKKYDISVAKKKPWNGGTILSLDSCPFDSNHRDPDSSVIIMKSGAIAFHCFHDSCANHDWKALRDMKEPDRKKSKQDKKPGDNVKTNKEVTVKKEYKTNGAFDYIDRIVERTPIYFDKAGQFWLWNEEGYYKPVDNTEILLTLLRNIADPAIIEKTFKGELLEAARLRGRDAQVKPVPNNWIHIQNGVYDINTGELLESTPDYLFTEPIPHKVSNSEDTPTIDKLFSEWVAPEKIRLLNEIAAYCLYNGYPIHRMFILIGRGRNGKGQYRDFIVNLIGHHNRAASTLENLIYSRFETARLYNKKICTMGEVNYTLLERTAILKMLTGGDPIPAEMKNKNPFEFVNNAKVIINTNSLPPTSDKTDAFYSRAIVVEFIKQYLLGRDIIETIPPEEYDNFLTKSLRVLRELLVRGAFSNEGSIQDKEREYERLSNPLAQFMKLHYEQDINGKVAAWRLMEEYIEYCTKNGFKKPLSKSNFNEMLKIDYDVEKKNLGITEK